MPTPLNNTPTPLRGPPSNGFRGYYDSIQNDPSQMQERLRQGAYLNGNQGILNRLGPPQMAPRTDVIRGNQEQAPAQLTDRQRQQAQMLRSMRSRVQNPSYMGNSGAPGMTPPGAGAMQPGYGNRRMYAQNYFTGSQTTPTATPQPGANPRPMPMPTPQPQRPTRAPAGGGGRMYNRPPQMMR